MSNIYKIKPQIPKGAKVISYSQYSLYAQCPWRWKLTYVDKHKIPAVSIHLIWGTSMHEVLQDYITAVFEDSVKAGDAMDLSQMLREKMTFHYKKMMAENGDVHFSNKTEMNEFHKDGSEILEYVRKKRLEYFPSKNHKLLGVEIPLLQQIEDYNVYLMGFIDLVILDERDNIIHVYDFKTSTRGWNDKDKKDEIKKSQIIMYKEYFAKQFNLSPDDIEVSFFILKRKLYESSDFVQKRVQIFSPPSGTITRKKVRNKLVEFVSKSFTKDGQYKPDADHFPIAGDADANCKYCLFKDRFDLCPKEKRLYY